MVAFGHIIQWTKKPEWPNVLLALGNGPAAVLLFFVISGFVLFRSLEAGTTPAKFIFGRVKRIYPAAAVTVLLFAAIIGAFGYDGIQISSGNIALNALLIRTDINGVMWSLKVEILAAPLILAAWSIWSPRLGWALLILAIALSFWGALNRFLDVPTTGLHAFALGMLAAHYRGDAGQLRNTLLVVCVMGFLFAPEMTSRTSHIGSIISTLFAGGLVWLVANGPELRLLGMRPLRYLGRISYSFYLLHPLSMLVLALPPVVDGIQAALVILGAGVTVTGVFLISVAITAPIAALLYRWIEVPGIQINRNPAPYPAA